MSLLTKEQYTRSLFVPDEDCAICSEPYNGTDHVPVRLNCGHWFGTSCAMKTAETSPSPSCRNCPMCRTELFGNVEVYRLCATAEESEVVSDLITPSRSSYLSAFAAWEDVYRIEESIGIAFMQLLKKVIQPYGPFLAARESTLEAFLASIDNRTFKPIYHQVIYILEGHIRRRHPDWSAILLYLRYSLDSNRPAVGDEMGLADSISPLNKLVRAMITHHSTASDAPLSPDVAKLWWKYLQCLTSSDYGLYSVPAPPDADFDTMHFLAVVETIAVQANPETYSRQSPSSWHLWLTAAKVLSPAFQDPDNLNKLHDWFIKELKKLQATSDNPLIPRLVGRADEEHDVRMLWQAVKDAARAFLARLREYGFTNV
ncbi:hypothetical protein BDV96DRAFT_641970 [Lophiotrema nucula]|uniref:RING-type domain-containing protein n=1 Tax=Lophiotrema nucula TaxID=690887 RepID=A0A6A5ZLG4_9PLEO|nr:hypothetical protein BDV96DRAFT_641970 [Lophiotrema nucula]